MTSYRTVLFSAVAFVVAAAPAAADSVPAVFKATAARPPIVRPADSVPAVFKSSTAPTRLPMDSVPAVFKSSTATTGGRAPMDSVPAVFKRSTAPTPGRHSMDSVPAVFKKSTAVKPQQGDALRADSIDAQDIMSMEDLFRFMFGNYLPFP